MINNKLVNTTLVTSGIFTLTLVLFPNLDLTISSFFYTAGEGFSYKNQFLVEFFFRLVPVLTNIFIGICAFYAIYIVVKHRSLKIFLRSGVFFLLITSLIGPGLVVNSLLKENFGRARPKQITEFNGKKDFSTAFAISDQCATNCSFSSGHAAMSFYLSAIAYVVSTLYFTKLYLFGLFFGGFVGLSRIVAGGHFASDVIASAFIVLFLNHLIYLLWKNKILKHKESQ